MVIPAIWAAPLKQKHIAISLFRTTINLRCRKKLNEFLQCWNQRCAWWNVVFQFLQNFYRSHYLIFLLFKIDVSAFGRMQAELTDAKTSVSEKFPQAPQHACRNDDANQSHP